MYVNPSFLSKLQRFPTFDSQRVISFLPKEHKYAKKAIPLFVFFGYQIKLPKTVELFGTFSSLDGTELKRNGTSYFVKIGTCNGTSYNFEPLERNLTSYI